MSGTDIFCCAGQKWKSHRKLITPTFHFKILETFVDAFNSNADILIKQLSTHVNGSEFDIQPYITMCALDNICGERNINIKYPSITDVTLTLGHTKGPNCCRINITHRTVKYSCCFLKSSLSLSFKVAVKWVITTSQNVKEQFCLVWVWRWKSKSVVGYEALGDMTVIPNISKIKKKILSD